MISSLWRSYVYSRIVNRVWSWRDVCCLVRIIGLLSLIMNELLLTLVCIVLTLIAFDVSIGIVVTILEFLYGDE